MLQINEIKLDINQSESILAKKILEKLRLNDNDWFVSECLPVKKSLDARDKERLRWIYTLRFSLGRTDGNKVYEDQIIKHGKARNVRINTYKKYDYEIPAIQNYGGKRPVVIGFGPCGIFAAYVLAFAGLRPIVLERGRPVEERIHHVDAYWKDGFLRENSNVLFGEGGAGTFSDGKLVSGIGDLRKTFVLETLAANGGGKDILYLSKPHLGTDILKTVVKNLRNDIISFGGEIVFGQKLIDIKTGPDNKITGVITETTHPESEFPDITEIDTDNVVLAIGHSARDTIEKLFDRGLMMEQKPFSMGARIQHQQKTINKSQYGKSASNPSLPAADYKLSCKTGSGRGVYTFCMCPGGQIIAASSEHGTICTNGMSERARDGDHANSAVLADVTPADFESDHALAGIQLQLKVERLAYATRQQLLREDGVNEYSPISETIKDFMGESSKLAKILPDFVTQSIKEALPLFGKRLEGFSDEDAILVGPETRSSSPVRILRDATMQSNVPGLYPCGEGAGYAGGIMSAAVDGIKAAEQILDKIE